MVSSLPDVDSMLTTRSTMLAAVRHQLHRAQQRIKHQADKRRSERSFKVGDSVYLKLQPYVESSLAPRTHQKYFGPYAVLERIGHVTYKLDLPQGSSVHPVFHVSLLKPAPSTKYPVSSSLPDVDDGLQVPEAILQHRLHSRRDSAVA
jgi:ribosomal protein L21E